MEILMKQLFYGRALFFIIALGIGGTFQNGFHISSINSPSLYIQDFINGSWVARYGKPMEERSVKLIWSAIVSVYSIGGLVGSLSVGYFTIKYGRKKCMFYNNIIALAAAVIMGCSRKANSFEMILVGRVLYGFSAGLGANVHAIYLGESAPRKIRGIVTMSAATFHSMGKWSGQFFGLSEVLGHEDLWHFLLAFASVPAVIQLISLPFFPEAPRYLLIDKGNQEMCNKALQKLWGRKDFKAEIEEMLEEQAAIKGEKPKNVWELLRDRSLRWQLITMVVILTAIQFSGVSIISSYAFEVFREAGIPDLKIRYVTLGVGATEVFTSITCGFLIDNIGRKALLWRAFSCMASTMALLTVTLYLKDTISWLPYFNIFLIFIFIMFYGLGPASVILPLCLEIFIQSSRPAAFVFTGILKWTEFAVIGMAFPFLLAELKNFSFLIFCGFCLCGALFVFFMVPETKGKTMLEISEEFNRINICRLFCRNDTQNHGETILATRL
ncbi:solute carrier family 2 member 9, like 1 [Acipenser ruthenus]|uniref:solute carrier family 2 member 9, like 1 n=1 Tax=Acipenser ruthenus TaxID=7906 RepID=UPI002741B33A|nr:solute carrier family 2 member 9, like 1 [Acipenser ruthenus]